MANVARIDASRSVRQPIQAAGQRGLVEILEAEHPTYTAMKGRYADWLNWYLGQNMEKYLHRHVRERETVFNRRKERASYFNYVGPIVDLIASFLFSHPPRRRERKPVDEGDLPPELQALAARLREQEQARLTRPSGSAILSTFGNEASSSDLEEFWSDVDGLGTTINEFMRNVLTMTMVWGHVDVVLDVMRLDPDMAPLQTEADRRAAGIRPYASVVTPLQLVNWRIDSNQEWVWARWKEASDADRGPFDSPSSIMGGEDVVRYITWSREEWWVHEVRKPKRGQASVVEIGHGPNPLGRVPLVRFYGQRLLNSFEGKSLVQDIGQVNVSIYNWASMIDEEIYAHTMNILVLEESPATKSEIEIGTNNALLWQGNHPPFYLAPASEPSQFILALIERAVQELYRMATLGGETGIQQAKSGIAYTWEFNQTNRMLADRADAMERGEIKLHQLWARWYGLEWEGEIDYPDEFNVQPFETEAARILQAKFSVRSPTFRREIEKLYVNRTLPKLPLKTLTQIVTEIETMDEGEQAPRSAEELAPVTQIETEEGQ